MAERRMFAKTIVLSDEFLDMPTSTRCLYFSLGMFADDDGFVNNPKSIIRQIGASVDDMNILIGKKFVIAFDDGVIVIKHWRIHNYIQSDRKKDTKYLADKETLFLDENKAYTQNYEHAKYLLDGTEIDNVSEMDTKCIQTVSIGKDSIGKDNISKNKEKDKEKDDTVSIPYQYSIYENYNFSDKVKDSIDLWLSYKKERKQTYKDTGLKVLLNRLQKDYDTYGEQYVIDSIESSIASNYQGIFAPKNKEKPKPEEKKCEYNFDSIYAEGTL